MIMLFGLTGALFLMFIAMILTKMVFNDKLTVGFSKKKASSTDRAAILLTAFLSFVLAIYCILKAYGIN